jgi:ubiquinone/menaquinone biosynthesis C-methylase UbiE
MEINKQKNAKAASNLLNESGHNLGREARDRALFDAIAVKYARKDLFASSRFARRQRLLQTVRTLPVKSFGDVLEVGCGAGYSSEYLNGFFSSFTGIDYSQQLIDFANGKFGNGRSRFEVANVKDFRPDREFDMIFMIGVLHHLDDISLCMRRMVEILRPGGWIVVNEPQPANRLIRGLRAARKKVDENYSDEQLQMGFSELVNFFVDAGLEKVEYRPQGIFSTPFAEVVLGPQWITAPVSAVCCLLDRFLESIFPLFSRKISWNAIAKGCKPKRMEF